MTDREYTPYQKGVIRRYYQNRDAIQVQKLQELVGEIYLAEPGRKKTERLWERAVKMLRDLGCPAARVEYIERTRDLKELSDVVGQLF